MIKRYLRWGMILLFAFIVGFVLGLPPADASTLSFKTEGIVRRDGKLTGQLVYSDAALQKAILESTTQQGVTEPIPISKIEGAEFSFKYISPYSGVEHTEATLCGKEIYDISGFEEKPLTGGSEPMLVLSSGGQPEFIDFSSCVGQPGSVASTVSQRDPRVASSTVDSLFGKLSVFDRDVMSNVLYKKIQPIKFTLRP
ncbi:MAG: hypothetical protein IGS38_15750 [Synechococcales cyanobacterium M58_A2018_015]|nr:hypothetical protein [Synechococcales cyanobacterium M58_A2018_015]